MRVVFRVDASIEIGSGHVMRCIAFAEALRGRGADCSFVCRVHDGNLIELIKKHGFHVFELAVGKIRQNSELEYGAWLGAYWKDDVEKTIEAIGDSSVDLMIVDHYALDCHWESLVKNSCKSVMVIDDLADRNHECDILLDQNLVEHMHHRYIGRVPKRSLMLLGPKYSLVREEFARRRVYSLNRRKEITLNRLLLFMGGSDPQNETSKVIEGLRLAKKTWKQIDVVVGRVNAHIQNLKKQIENFSEIKLHIQVSNMAALMSECDFAITAGGSITWEKCTLGLPSFIATQGANEHLIAEMMNLTGCAELLGSADDLSIRDYSNAIDSLLLDQVKSMSCRSSLVCDGLGIKRVLNSIGI